MRLNNSECSSSSGLMGPYVELRLSEGAVLTMRTEDLAVVRAYVQLGPERVLSVHPSRPSSANARTLT